MPDQFLHGVEVVQVSDGVRSIRTVRSSVIGLIGTAPDSEAAVAASLTVGTGTSSLVFTADAAGVAGNNISVRIVKPNANSQALAVSITANAILISLATDNTGVATSTATLVKAALDANTTIAALVAVAISGGGAGVVAPVNTRYLTGGLDEAFPLNTPVALIGQNTTRTGLAGSIPQALEAIFKQIGAVVVVVRVAVGEDDDATADNIKGASADNSGMYALVSAESVTGVSPKILIAPGYTDRVDVLSEFQVIANRLRGFIFGDGPNTTDSAAIDYSRNFGSQRIMLIDPKVKIVDDGATVADPASAYVAGLMARIDNELGFWWSPSNQEIYGIVGTWRPIDFVLGDVNSRANVLNENNVTTIIRQNGFRLWGNHTLSADPKFTFINVVRTGDILADSLTRAHFWAVDRNITRTYIEDVRDGVNAYMRSLVALGALVGTQDLGKQVNCCIPNAELNSPENIAAGKIYFDFFYTANTPAEHVTFRSILNNNGYVELATV